jgi:hypothetical protein
MPATFAHACGVQRLDRRTDRKTALVQALTAKALRAGSHRCAHLAV